MNEAAKAVDNGRPVPASGDHEQRIKQTLTTLWDTTAREFSERILGNQKATITATQIMDGIMAEWVREYGTQKIKQITETTQEDIALIVRSGIKEGKSEREIGKLIRAIATTKSASRAQTIARTETHAASQASANASAQATGIEMQRVWVASNGERTRDTHRAADGQMVGMNDTFTVGGSELRYPGDPNGPAAEVINCFTGDTMLSCDSIKKSIRSIYSGELITIKTASGYKLTGTPNHPVMADGGIIRLDEVDHLTNLMSCPLDVNITGSFDVDNIPSTFEKIHNSLTVIGMIVRVAGSPVDLYGRVPDSDVDVVGAKCFLRNDNKSKLFKLSNKGHFRITRLGKGILFGLGLKYRASCMKFRGLVSDSLIGMTDLLASLLTSHRLPLQKLCFGLASSMNSFSFKNCFNRAPLHAVFDSNLVFTHSSNIVSNSIGFRKVDLIPSKTGSGTSDELVAMRLANSELFRDFNNTKSRFVKADKVVDIDRNFVHESPVYTVETKEGFYNAGGIVSRNCRCAVVFEIID